MNNSERITRLEQDLRTLAAEHEALQQISATLFSALPMPPETMRALLTLSYDSMHRQMEARGESAAYRKEAAECHDTLSAAILGDMR